MPELPEVYTTAEYYQQMLPGHKLLKIIHHTDKCGVNLQNFKPGRVRYVTSEGKKIVIRVAGKQYICVFLRMFGKLLPRIHDKKHHHVTLKFDEFELYYCDKGGLGYGDVTLCSDVNELRNYMSNVGRDFIRRNVKRDEWLDYMLSKRSVSSIAVILRDKQDTFSGIGNYLTSDILYRAEIDPRRRTCDLSEKELKRLFNSIIFIIKLSISQGGMTMIDYVRPDGKPGYYDTLVYGKTKDPDGNPITKIKLGGRPIYYVEAAQI